MTSAAQSGNAGGKTKRACLYLRVSTASKTKHDNSTFNQMIEDAGQSAWSPTSAHSSCGTKVSQIVNPG